MDRGVVVVTAHRRESHGAGLATVSAAVRALARSAALGGRWAFVVVAHTHPRARRPLLDAFGLASVVDLERAAETTAADTGTGVDTGVDTGGVDSSALGGALEGVAVVEPLDYATLVALLRRADAVVTDSGGLQEEAAALGVPAVVVRDETDRPEAVAAGLATVAGCGDAARIVDAVEATLLAGEGRRPRFPRAFDPGNPFGDGTAGEAIVEDLLSRDFDRWPPG